MNSGIYTLTPKQKEEWIDICAALKKSGADLGRIMITCPGKPRQNITPHDHLIVMDHSHGIKMKDLAMKYAIPVRVVKEVVRAYS